MKLLLLFAAVAAASPIVRRQDKQVSGRSGAVATNFAKCSDVGRDILQSGGTAADAAVAAVLCIGVIGGSLSGIGGGGFMLVRNASAVTGSKYEMIDFRETMPAAGNETMYSNNADKTASTIGGLSTGVPGEIAGLKSLHDRHGRLGWAALFAPAIDLARNGFTQPQDVDDLIEGESTFLVKDPLWAETYAPNGTLATAGQTLYRKRLANALERIAKEGPSAFYGNGNIAQNIVKAAAARNGIITLQDLANYSVEIRTPVNASYRDMRVFSTVAPSSGTVLLSALKIFEGYPGNITEQANATAYDLATHRLIQATRFAYGQRTTFGDPAFTSNVSALERQYLETETVTSIRALITDNATHGAAYYDVNRYLNKFSGGTHNIAVIDKDQNAVSLTTTVNLSFGSQVMTEDGIILNDEMDDFSSPGQANSFGFAASPINFIRPGKRPQSSICGSIAEDLETGELRIVAGAAGGSRIITTTLQNLRASIDFGLSPAEVQRRGRWHDQLSNVTLVDVTNDKLGVQGFSNRTTAFLTARGYNITYGAVPANGPLIIRDKQGQLFAESDPRSAGGTARAAAF